MRMIKCWNCGQIAEAAGESALCPQCRNQLRVNSVLRERVCRTCGSTFLGGPRAWYCPNCRAERARVANREAKARARAGKTRRLGSTDICQICGKEYTVEGGLQRYCPECAPAAIQTIARTQSREWMTDHREEAVARKKEIAKNRRVCTVCGQGFYSRYPSVTCSAECATVLKAYRQAVADHKRRGTPVPTMEAVVQRLAMKSGVPGVSRSRNGKRWVTKYKNKYIGTFDTILEAKRAIDLYKNASAE